MAMPLTQDVHRSPQITCKVAHIKYIVAQMLKVSIQHIKRDVHSRMTYVSPAEVVIVKKLCLSYVVYTASAQQVSNCLPQSQDMA